MSVASAEYRVLPYGARKKENAKTSSYKLYRRLATLQLHRPQPLISCEAPGARAAIAFAAAAVVPLLGSYAHAASGTWTYTGTAGTWSTTTDWQSGTVAGGSGYTADFSKLNITANNTVTIPSTSPVTIGNILFGDSGAGTVHEWIVSGGTVTLVGGSTPTIQIVTAVDVNIASQLVGSQGFTFTAPSTTYWLNLSADNSTTLTGNITVSSGDFQLGNTNAAFNNTLALTPVNSLDFSASIGTFTIGGLSVRAASAFPISITSR